MLTVALSALRTHWVSFAGSFVALALGVGLLATMGLGLASTVGAPEQPPRRFAASPVVVAGTDTVTVDGAGPKKLDRPHPVDSGLLRDLQALGPVTADGTPNAVGIDAPAAAVRKVVGDRARVLTGAGRRQSDPEAERDAEALTTANALLGTAGGVTAFVSVFVVASTFAFAVALRAREFGLLRTTGATPGQIRRLLLTEAAGVGVLASAAGCALGAWGAPRLAEVLVRGDAAPPWFTIGDGIVWPYWTAFSTGLLVALCGAWAASRRAGHIGPMAALRESDVDSGVLTPVRRIAGCTLLIVGAGLLVWTLATDPSGLLKRKTYTTRPMVLITAVALLAPLLVRPLARALPLPGATGLLVRENTAAALRRTAAVAAPVLVTVGLAGSLLGTAETVTAAKAAEARRQTSAHLVVTGEELRPVRVPGATVSASASTAVFVREDGAALIRSDARAVSDPAAFARIARLPVVAGDPHTLDDSSIIVNEEWERHTVGERVTVRLGDGRPASLRIAAVMATGTGNNGVYITAANATAARTDRIDVRLGSGAAEPAAVREALRASGGEVRTADAWAAATHPRTSPKTRLGLLVVLGIAVLYTVIALGNTLLMATAVRSREFGSLRSAGATRAQILRVVAGESLLAVGIGALLGAAVTAVNLVGLGAALASLSAPVTVTIPWGTAGAAAGVCAVVALAAALLPAWGATRR
ncbi:ABC transporter permease [Streptomyces sp. NBC_00306]|uniref:ABC transporter permease n=1 Tax=Streptomyces sp. NBC_00306 TaxID=2975708 RepID=UPI002E2C4050|nr:ABC transporter permease [Streptomyces sp. NBC_00306]